MSIDSKNLTTTSLPDEISSLPSISIQIGFDMGNCGDIYPKSFFWQTTNKTKTTSRSSLPTTTTKAQSTSFRIEGFQSLKEVVETIIYYYF